MDSLAGRKALVTGSSRGIGYAISKQLLSLGCAVTLNGRTPEILAGAVAGLRTPNAHAVPGDVTDPSSAATIISQSCDHMDGLDLLVCNVGSGASVPPGEENFEEWQRVFSLNLWSATNIIEAAIDKLAENKGTIVCISSICGQEVIPGAPVTYSAAKSALNAYVKGAARPFGARGVRINAIAPGNVYFNGSVWHRKTKEDPEKTSAMLMREVSLARFGKPEEIADLVCYLSSNRTTFATGAIWALDGGQTRC